MICKPLAVLCIVPFVSSCTYGDYSYSTMTRIRSTPPRSRPRDRLDFFFGDRKPARPFIQIALIEAVGGTFADDEELLVRLKHRAALCGADAVIGINKTSKARETGTLFCKGDCTSTYGATVFRGIAVVYAQGRGADQREESAQREQP